jgi:hypothetical protein
MEQANIQNGKSQLAKLLATENIAVQHKPGAKTAWFDVKNRVLCLPVWHNISDDLYDLLVVHEVGHALDTPPEGWADAIKDIALRVTGSASNRAMGAVKGFLNVIEDARIDKRQKRRFPGARRNYVKGYKELIERDFFGTEKRDVNQMSFIDRLNIYCKGGSMMGIKFSPVEKKMLLEVENAETFDEVLKLTEKIFTWSKDQQDQDQENDPDDMGSEAGEDDGEWSESDDSDSGDMPYDDDSETDETDGNGNADGEASDDDEDGNKSGKTQSDDRSNEYSDTPINMGSQNGSGDDNNLPESETEKSWQKTQDDLIKNSDERYIYLKLPRPVDINKMVVDYKQVLAEQRSYLPKMWQDKFWQDSVRAELMKFRADENATISFMVKEFEMRKSADEYSRTSVSKTGVIDMNKLHTYKYNDDLFRRVTSVATGKNHGFVMFVDWSGSMQSNLKKTLKQLFSLAMFCKRVQIPFEVYSFRSVLYTDYKDDGGTLLPDTQFFSQNQDEISMDPVMIRNILSSRMKIQELNDAMYHLWLMGCGGHMPCDGMSSTPLNECIALADLVVNKFHNQSKVQVVNTIFLTDGESDPIYGFHGKNQYGYGWSGKTKYILQDDLTKKSYDIRYSLGDRRMTSLLLKVLKDRTNCNLIGFFINGDGFQRVWDQYKFGVYDKRLTDAKKSWTNDGFFPVDTAGYDEYYILNPKMFNVSTNKELVVDSNMTRNKAAKEFIKFSEKKTVSRVLLSRFVKRIAA